MPRCLECGEDVSPIHAMEYPTHTIIVQVKNPAVRKILEGQVEDFRTYGFLPRPSQGNEHLRKYIRRGIERRPKEEQLEEDEYDDEEDTTKTGEQAKPLHTIVISAMIVAGLGVFIAIIKAISEQGQ